MHSVLAEVLSVSLILSTEHGTWCMMVALLLTRMNYDSLTKAEANITNICTCTMYLSEHLNVQSEVCDKSLIVKFQNSLPSNGLSGIHFSLVPFQPQAVYFHL